MINSLFMHLFRQLVRLAILVPGLVAALYSTRATAQTFPTVSLDSDQAITITNVTVEAGPGVITGGTTTAGDGVPITELPSFQLCFSKRSTGQRMYEVNDHLNNVRAVVSDKRLAATAGPAITDYSTDVLSWDDYYAYGQHLNGRHYTNPDYRYGINGLEEDDEWKGDGLHQTSSYREYDTRVGRWMSRDPVTHFHQSPYNAFDANPVALADPSGADAEGDPVTDGGDESASDPIPTTAGIGVAIRSDYVPVLLSGIREYHYQLWRNTPPASVEMQTEVADATGDHAPSDPEVQKYMHDHTHGYKDYTYFSRRLRFDAQYKLLNTEQVGPNTINPYLQERMFGKTRAEWGEEDWHNMKFTMAQNRAAFNFTSEIFMWASGDIAVAYIPRGINWLRTGSNNFGRWFRTGGKSFREYKKAQGGTRTLGYIQTSKGAQRISIEYHHAIIPQRLQPFLFLINR